MPIKKKEKTHYGRKLKWVEVSSLEFRKFVTKIQDNYKLNNPDQACTIWWGMVPLDWRRKHRSHSYYMIKAEFFKDARAYMKLWKSHGLVNGTQLPIFEDKVPDTIGNSNEYEQYFSNELKDSQKRKILEPVKFSTLMRTDVDVERLANENDNVKHYFVSEVEKVKRSISKCDKKLDSLVKKAQFLLNKNENQNTRLKVIEDWCLKINNWIEQKTLELEYNEKAIESFVNKKKLSGSF